MCNDPRCGKPKGRGRPSSRWINVRPTSGYGVWYMSMRCAVEALSQMGDPQGPDSTEQPDDIIVEAWQPPRSDTFEVAKALERLCAAARVMGLTVMNVNRPRLRRLVDALDAQQRRDLELLRTYTGSEDDQQDRVESPLSLVDFLAQRGEKRPQNTPLKFDMRA